jgi:hypothetical protein
MPIGDYRRDILITVTEEIVQETSAAKLALLIVLRSQKDRNVFELLSGRKLFGFW